MWRFLSSLMILSAFSAGPALAQSVDVGQLGAAKSFDQGPLDTSNGGFDAALWQGVSAQRASAQIGAINSANLSELPYRFMRRVLLSAGVPPEGDEVAQAEYLNVSTAAKLQLGDYAALESLSDTQNPLQRDAEFRVNLALASGDPQAACEESDRAIDDRTAPFWMQMRIVCHLMRDESAAAELTLNLMRERDDRDADFIALADFALGLKKNAPKNTPSRPILDMLKTVSGAQRNQDPQALTARDHVSTALSSEAPADVRIEALFKSERRISPEQVKSIMSEILFSDAELAGGTSFDVQSALAGLQENGSRAKSIAQLYSLATNYSDLNASAQAMAALLALSETVDFTAQMTEILSESVQFIPANIQVETDAPRFAWAALRRADLAALGGIYRALDSEDPLAGRIALASDALGNGFVLGQLGLDIETRLAAKGTVRRDAVRDALIAVALGSRLSDEAAAMLAEERNKDTLNPVGLTLLNASAKEGARAGTLLYVVQAMGAREPSKLSRLEIYTYISALTQAGLTKEAGELAAFDFLSRRPVRE